MGNIDRQWVNENFIFQAVWLNCRIIQTQFCLINIYFELLRYLLLERAHYMLGFYDTVIFTIISEQELFIFFLILQVGNKHSIKHKDYKTD